MGRAGSGGGGRSHSHSSSGGHRSSSRSGGGHRVGSSHSSSGRRAGSGSYGGGPPRGGHGGPPPGRGPGHMPPPPPRGGYGGYPPPPPPPRRCYRVYRTSGGGVGGALITIAAMLIVITIVFIALRANMYTAGFIGGASQKSTIQREKLETGNAYINDCVIDEPGWFDSLSRTQSRLKEFWEATGVQPYIIFRDYDAGLTTDAQKEQWASDYYDANFDTENIFLFVYFAEADTDNDVGYMCYANGYETSSVMDSEAVEIFWNYIDRYWYTDLSTDDVMVNAFCDTSDTIMHVSTTGKDIVKWILIVVVVIAVGVIVVSLIKQKNRRAKEKAEEDQRILDTPINDIAKDDLEDKYL